MTAPDAIVVGAGVTGLAVAHRLATSGRRVLRLGRPTAEGAATPASGAMLGVLAEVTPDEDEDALSLRIAAARAHQEWADRGAVPPAYGTTFVVAGGRRPEDLEALAAMEKRAAARGLPCERVEPEDVPGLRPAADHRPARVLHLATERGVDVEELIKALHAPAPRVEASDEDVVGLEHRDDRVTGVRTSGGVVAAPEVVLCAGVASTGLLEASGLDAKLLPPTVVAKGVGLVLDGPAYPRDHVLRTPNRDFACGLHLVPRCDGSVYLGATNRASRLPETLGHATAGEVAQLIAGAAAELRRDVPAWNLRRVVWGRRPLPVDGRPFAGRTAMPGLSAVGGTYRNGVLLAPLLADRLVAEWEGVPPDAAWSPRRPLAPSDPMDVFARGRRDVTRLLQDPAWTDSTGAIIEALAAGALSTSTDAQRLVTDLRRLLADHGRPEMLPEAFVELLQAWAPNRPTSQD